MGIPGVEGLESRLAGISETVRSQVPNKSRQYVTALRNYLENCGEWETVWEWNVHIGKDKLTVLRIQRFRFF